MAITDLPIFRCCAPGCSGTRSASACSPKTSPTPTRRIPAARPGAAANLTRPAEAAATALGARCAPTSGHIAGFGTASRRVPVRRAAAITKCSPAGNAVNLEDQMMKVAANQMDYPAATSLYAAASVCSRPRSASAESGGARRCRGRHMDFLQIDGDRGLGPARAGRAHAGHLGKHRQRGFHRADARRRSLSPQDADLPQPSSTARWTPTW